MEARPAVGTEYTQMAIRKPHQNLILLCNLLNRARESYAKRVGARIHGKENKALCERLNASNERAKFARVLSAVS